MEERYVTVVGIEIHAELKTKSKMFARSANDPDEKEPNVNIDPVNMAHPGTLPTINKKAIEHMIKIGLAVNGTIANYTEFDRKNYFYPDIPKGYQISQYKYPIVAGGNLAGVSLERIHLEEDTGTSKHDRGDYSLIDYNRAGVPLMELVSDPVIYNPADAARFAAELQLLLRTLGVGDANMEKGEMRVEANISVMKTDKNFEELHALYKSDKAAYFAMLGTKVEVKNLNSFKSVERAIEFETKRMIDLIESGRGNEIIQETRGWDENKLVSSSQRKKESAQDYRYFPDPDLPKLYLHELFDLQQMKSELPELPWQKRERYKTTYGLNDDAIEIYVADTEFANYFETVAAELGDASFAKTASNYMTSDFAGIAKENPEAKLPPVTDFVKLMKMVHDSIINSRGAKDILLVLATVGGDPETIADEKGLVQKSDPEAIKKIAQQVIAENPEQVAQYKAGNEKTIKFLMGQGMKLSQGSANPAVLEQTLAELMK